MQTFERCDILSDGELIVISVSWDRTGHEGFIADARGAIRAQSRAVAFFSSRDGKLVSHGDHARDSSSHDTFQNSRDIHVTSRESHGLARKKSKYHLAKQNWLNPS